MSGERRPPLCGNKAPRRQGAVVELKFRGQRRPEREFALDQPRAEAGSPLLHQKSADRIGALRVDAGFAVDFGPDHGNIGDGAVADPSLRAAQAITVGGLAGVAAQTARIGAKAGLGESKTTELRALRHLWKPAALLFLGPEKIDRRHRE